MENIVSKELEVGIDGVARIVPSIRKVIAPLINFANEEQINKDYIDLKEVASYHSRGFVVINHISQYKNR